MCGKYLPSKYEDRSSIPETRGKKMVSVTAGAYNLSQHGGSRGSKIPRAQ